MIQTVLCSNCFTDEGLRLDAFKIGIEESTVCPHCMHTDGRKLDKELTEELAYRYFVRGSFCRMEYGGAPLIQFNDKQKTSIVAPSWLRSDVKLIESCLGIGFFRYGPRMWMVGDVGPLLSLRDPAQRPLVINRVLSDYPTVTFSAGTRFYRVRKNPSDPANFAEYDSHPVSLSGRGRLDSALQPVMYGSQDIEVCVHECRATVEDDLFVATLAPKRDLKLLDVTHVLKEDTTEFQSLDMTVHMLFLAGDYSYEISREIALAAKKAGLDGIIFPSYFSLTRTGAMPFNTIYGISVRRFPLLERHVQSQTIRNLALFGRPVEENMVNVLCINRVVLSRVDYIIQFGPVGIE